MAFCSGSDILYLYMFFFRHHKAINLFPLLEKQLPWLKKLLGLAKAKDFDESHQVSATATAKVSELSQRIGLSDKISAGIGAVKSVDQRYNVSETTMAAASTAGRSVAAAANSLVNSSYFSKGALWVSGALTRAAQVASDMGTHRDRQ